MRGEWFKFKKWKVRLSFHNLSNYTSNEVITRFVTKAILHPDEIMEPHPRNDVAILELDDDPPVHEDCCAARIRLATREIEQRVVGNNNNQTGSIAGWGSTSPYRNETKASDPLMAVETDLPAPQECQPFYEGFQVDDRVVCAGLRLNGTTCRGDSGGPLTVKVDGEDYLLGITSFGGADCGSKPAVYTSVAAYRNWIFEAIGGDPGPPPESATNCPSFDASASR